MKLVSSSVVFACFALLMARMTEAFVPPSGMPAKSYRRQSRTTFIKTPESNPPTALQRQRHSVASVQTMGLFGLGLPEIALILIAAAFLLGPQNLADLAKDAGKTASEFSDELKNVPKEFQKGLEEGEVEARSKKAKRIKAKPKGDEQDE